MGSLFIFKQYSSVGDSVRQAKLLCKIELTIYKLIELFNNVIAIQSVGFTALHPCYGSFYSIKNVNSLEVLLGINSIIS